MRYLADFLIAEQDCIGGGCVWYSRYGFEPCDINRYHGYSCCLRHGALLEC